MKPVSIENFKGDFFKVFGETELSQVAAMTIESGSDSGAYGLHKGDQIIFIIEGEGELEVEDEKWKMKRHQVAIIPAGRKHKMHNTGKEKLFFLNVYAPPEY